MVGRSGGGARASVIALPLLAAAVGCGSGGDSTPTLLSPAGIEWAALIMEDAEGRIDHAAGLVRVSGAARFEIKGGDVRARVIGFAAKDLEPYAPPGEEILAASALREAGPCDSKLPAPSWDVPLRVDDSRPLGDALAVPLTADWLNVGCPSLGEIEGSSAIDAGCTRGQCRPNVTQSDCSATIDFEGCDEDAAPVKGRLDRRGMMICLESAPPSCRVTPPSSERLYFSLDDCGLECTVDVHRPAAREPPWTAEVVSVLDVPERTPSGADSGRYVDPSQLTAGYLSDLAVLADGRIAVAQPASSYLDPPCRARSRSRVRFFDGETLAATGDVDAPPCLVRIVPDPERAGGWYGVYGAAPSLRIGRFDPAGVQTASVAIDVDRHPTCEQVYRTVEALALDTTPERRIAVVMTHEILGQCARGSTMVRLFRSTDLAEVAGSRSSTIGRSLGAAMIGSGRVAVASDSLDCVHVYDGRVGRFEERLICLGGPLQRLPMVLGGVYADPTTPDRLLAVTSGDFKSAQRFDELTWSGGAQYFDLPAEPMILHAWSGAPAPIWVGLVASLANGRYEARGAFLDPTGAHPHFVRGSWPIGPGAPSRVRADPRGRLLVLLAWSAKLVRIVKP